ncbi:hypothetical protein KM043_010118 [Ampulex compressa]|nr:hypothetical protein KM043_010118 [Ampulex compressa]
MVDSQMVYQRGNQREGSPHYVLLYSEDENSGDEDGIPLQIHRKTTSLPQKVEVINVQLKPDDTLQALALRYHCTISELKRINKIHKENEIYARRNIKVPVQPFSILSETMENEQNPGSSETEVQGLVANKKITDTAREQQIVDLNTISTESKTSKAEINTIIMNSVCEPLVSYSNANSSDVSATEYEQLLYSTENTDIHVTDSFKCSGDDWGLSWTQVVGFSLCLGIGGPIIYYLSS